MVRQQEATGVESQASETQRAIAKRYISADLLELFTEREAKRRKLQRRRSVARLIGNLLGVPFPSIVEGVVGRLGQAYRLPGGHRFFSTDGETFVDEEGSTFVAADDHQYILLEDPPRFAVILEMNVDVPGGPQAARQRLLELLTGEPGASGPAAALRDADILMVEKDGSLSVADAADFTLKERETVALGKSQLTDRYLFATLQRATIERLVRVKAQLATPDSKAYSLIYKAWPDRAIKAFVYESAKTIKADAACIAFSARGEGIVWAVADTGIDASHPHFVTHDTLKLPQGLFHLDFTASDIAFDADMPTALQDPSGHGTHVAGIIAGECAASAGDEYGAPPRDLIVRREVYRSDDLIEAVEDKVLRICGVAPLCKLMSLRVLNEEREGEVSSLLAAIGQLLRFNDYGHRMRVHGLNLSVGYEFNAEWFATGHSPLCNEVDRLVRIGMVVVVAAGNAGFGRVTLDTGKQGQAAHGGTIADPGNAELAITVGSTHRDMPHAYGVSYFSSKGPTADGRAKPDVLAPGERIVSCAANAAGNSSDAVYREESGTSMAAPHVSGAAAAFLSIRREFIGRPDAVKALFLSTATDLKRLPHYQGRGLVDLMRAIQAV